MYVSIFQVQYKTHRHISAFKKACILKRKMCCAQLLSRAQLFTTPWTPAARLLCAQGFSRQEYCVGLPCLSQGDFLLGVCISDGFCHLGDWKAHENWSGQPTPSPERLTTRDKPGSLHFRWSLPAELEKPKGGQLMINYIICYRSC